jgi:uncharacterized iron-regulated membrane protein
MGIALEVIRERPIAGWQRWLHHPEQTWLRRLVFHLHLWLGMMTGFYVLGMSLSGVSIVFRNELEINPNSRVVPIVEWVVDLHENLLFGMTGRSLNGVGAICLSLLCITGAVLWWPGIIYWRRGLTINWRSSFARMNWDLHNALGFWCFLFVLMWGISGIYFAFPQVFNDAVDIVDPGTSNKLRLGDEALSWLSNLHFGRFGAFAEVLWALVGFVPAVLAFTGVFMCCHRLLVRKGAPLPK